MRSVCAKGDIGGFKIYYDGRQCRSDPFKIGDTVKWDASKFNAQDRFVFKDADYSYEAHGRKSAR